MRAPKSREYLVHRRAALDLRDAGGLTLAVVADTHGHPHPASAQHIAAAHPAGVVVCGHSHVPFAGHHRGLFVFNPGSIGPRRFRLPIVFGVLDITSNGLTVRHVDCETGEPWAPPPRARE